MSTFEFSEFPLEPQGPRRPARPTPLLVGGIIAAVALAARAAHSPLGAWLRGFLSRLRERGGMREDVATRRMRRRMIGLNRPAWMIRNSLLGRRKSAVAAALGPPRTAVLPRGVAPSSEYPVYWHADTWYYAMSTSRTAMAVRFVGGIVSEIEFFEAPAAPGDSAGAA